MYLKTAVVLILTLLFGSARAADLAPKLVLQKGDHIALVGGAIADRFQHSGWLESLIVSRYPENQLVFRNLAVAGDEVAIRHRSENFGLPEDWLKRVQADVIFAFFGFNESFQGEAGLTKFKGDLDKYLKDTLAGNYSGKGHPRIVLFSSAANEKHQDPNFPDPTANNARIVIYSKAMAEVAAQNGVLFVDLYEPSAKLFAAASTKSTSLTVNGIYLTSEGDRQLAPIIFEKIFGEPAPEGDISKLRSAVNEKNAEWHARYRTIDGYNVYGGRSQLSFESGKGGPQVSNYHVMQEEMSQRDVLTANRDKRVWAVAKGSDLVPDESNLPPVTEVKSNIPGPNPDKSHVFLSGEEAIKKMTVHSGMKVNLFASEDMFPELVNPVQMAWDTRGRLWVAAWLNYPERSPTSKTGDSLLIFEDTDGDGKADKCTHFADDLNGPTGFQFYKDGVLLIQAPDVWFLRDTDGDGKADWKELILMGLDSADSHHTANAICLDPSGSIYLSDGVFHRTQIETAAGPVRNNDAAIFRFEPRTGSFETYIPYGFANPHGRVFDYWGNDIVTDATGNASYFGPAFSGRLDYPAKHPGMREFWNRPSRPCPGTGILTSRHFPEEFQGNFLNLNVISFQGIYRVKVTEGGSGLKGETKENLISSSDPNFRPIAVSIGPDGAIYVCDWHNAIIGHMQHHLRDPNRNHHYGRIYRITYPGRPLMKPVRIQGQPIPALLALLKEPENQTRELAKVELGTRNTAEVLAALKSWIASLDKQDASYEHQMMEALWVQAWHNAVDASLLDRMLASSEPNARAAAGRVLCYWRDRVPNSIAKFATLAADTNPRVRLEAVRGASFYRESAAAEVALAVLKQPMDYYLDYTLKETLRQLEPAWRSAISEGRPIAANNPAGIDYLIGRLSVAELLKMPRTPKVLESVLLRNSVQDADRLVALDELANALKKNRVETILDLVASQIDTDLPGAVNVGRLLPYQLEEQLKPARARLEALAISGKSTDLRQAGWASLIVMANAVDPIWAMAEKNPAALADLLNGLSLLTDVNLRSKAFPKVKPLLSENAPMLVALSQGSKSTNGRFVRVELPRNGTLTLAEVQVLSEGRNVALKGKASQSTVSNGGEASRAIDGRTDGSYGSGTQTHTEEDQLNPWWEVDLGGEMPIEAVTIWNRTDASLGKRLEGYTLIVLNGQRTELFRKTGNPAPAPSATLTVQSDLAGAVQRAAIRASVTLNEQPASVFSDLAMLVAKGKHTSVSAQSMRVLPRASWPKADAGRTAVELVKWARTIPASERTSRTYVETVQFASDLAGFLPSQEAAVVRKDLKELRVPVVVIRTVREQMRYDTPRIVVEAGKPLEIIVENADFMPHNLAVIQPGSREKVGMAASLMKPDQTDGRGRAFIPSLVEIIASTKLLEAGQSATLSITAPNNEGNYEYVCTFPGHFQIMWGTMVVTRDVDAYLSAHPDAPIQPAASGVGHDHNHQ